MRGPLGKGLSIQPQGKHIAYTAGTGVLVFMDLVAHLLVRLVEAGGGAGLISGGSLGGDNCGSGPGDNGVG